MQSTCPASSPTLAWLLDWKKEQALAHMASVLSSFQASDAVKLRTLRQLTTFLGLVDGRVDHAQFNSLFKLLAKVRLAYLGNQDFAAQIGRCVSLLSSALFFDDIAAQILASMEKDSATESMASLATTLSLFEVISAHGDLRVRDPQALLESVLSCFSQMEGRFYDNPLQLTRNAFLVLSHLSAQPFALDFQRIDRQTLCKVLITLKTSSEKQPVFSPAEFDALLHNYSRQFATPLEHFLAATIGAFLEKTTAAQEWSEWNEFTAARKQFMGLLLHFPGTALLSFGQLLPVLQCLVGLDKDPVARFEALEALTVLFKASPPDSPATAVWTSTANILTKVIQPAMTWKVGKPNTKIRKAAVSAAASFYGGHLDDPSVSTELFIHWLPQIKTCMADDHDPDLRMMALELLRLVFLRLRDSLKQPDAMEVYAAVLERLDDAQDPIRIHAVVVFGTLFACKNCEFSSSLIEYILKVLFVHFDDSNEQLQTPIYGVLRLMAERVGTAVVAEAARLNVCRFRYPDKCNQLISELTE